MSETNNSLQGAINPLEVYHTDAYAIAVAHGFKGSITEWLESLKGEKGDKGEKGNDGYTPVKGVDYFDGEKGEKGDKGDSGGGGGSADYAVIAEHTTTQTANSVTITFENKGFKKIKVMAFIPIPENENNTFNYAIYDDKGIILWGGTDSITGAPIPLFALINVDIEITRIADDCFISEATGHSSYEATGFQSPNSNCKSYWHREQSDYRFGSITISDFSNTANAIPSGTKILVQAM